MTRKRKLRLRPRGVFVLVALGVAIVGAAVLGIASIGSGTRVAARSPGPQNSSTPALATPTPTATRLDPRPAHGATPKPSASPSATPEPAVATAPPYPVAHDTLNLVDHSRDTPARGNVPARSGRVLLTVILRPVGPTGPLPVVVFGHGWDSNPSVYEPLLSAWAAAGYLVAAPTFPSSASTLPGSPVSDYPDQARDLSFVVTALLGGSAGPVNAARIAVAGHSDGGTDIALMALNPTYADPRVRAYLSLSSEIPAGLAGPWGAPVSGSLLVAVGTSDEYGLAPRSRQVFDTASVTAKVMLTAVGGGHIGIFVGSSPQAAAVRQETVRFLDAALQGGPTSSDHLASALTPTGDASVSVTPGPGG